MPYHERSATERLFNRRKRSINPICKKYLTDLPITLDKPGLVFFYRLNDRPSRTPLAPEQRKAGSRRCMRNIQNDENHATPPVCNRFRASWHNLCLYVAEATTTQCFQ